MRFFKTILFILLFGVQNVSAQISISEIMYDLSGSDMGREWIEIINSGSGNVTIATSTWKFFEADTNHNLSLFQGSAIIPAGGFAVIADNPQKFLVDWPNFSGTIFDSVFSLGNTSELIAIKSDTGTVVDEVTYASSVGGAGDGNSLQKVSGAWTALISTPGSGHGTGSEEQGTSSPVATTTPDSVSSYERASSVPGSDKTSWPVEPRVFSRIVGPTLGIAGADVVFKGEAVGLDKTPLKNVRYLWNFGDGATKEGEAVLHAYNFPAEYVVILEASSGHFEGASRVRIKIIPADIIISEVVAGFDGKIELVNNATQELDLSWWRIRNGNKFFTLPKNSKMLPAGRLPLSATVMGFPVVDKDVALLYPNGSLAYQFVKSVPEPTGVVFSISNSTPKNEEVSAAPLPEVFIEPAAKAVPEITDKAAAVVLAIPTRVETEVSNEDVSADGTQFYSSLWLYGTGGVILLGLAFALFPKPTVVRSPADEYEIIE